MHLFLNKPFDSLYVIFQSTITLPIPTDSMHKLTIKLAHNYLDLTIYYQSPYYHQHKRNYEVHPHRRYIASQHSRRCCQGTQSTPWSCFGKIY